MNRIKTQRSRSFAIADPVGLPHGAPPIAWPARAPGKQERIAIVGEGDWMSRTRELVEAAGARVEWSDVGPAKGAVERALAEAAAVIVASAEAVRVESRSRTPRFHTVARGVSNLGSSAAPKSLETLDLLLVGPTLPSAASWERSVRLACVWARDEGRARVHCAVRDRGWPILASDRAIRFRRVVREHGEVEALRTTYYDARRRLLFEAGAYDVLVADADDLDALARSACAGVGWCGATPSLWLGDDSMLLDLDVASSARARSADAALAASLGLVRLLRHLGERAASARLASAIRSEVAERADVSRDVWLDLASDTPGRFLDALCARLAAAVTRAN